MSWSELVPGKRYKVSFEDCCVQGWFEATFLEFEPDEDGDPWAAVFDTARITSDWGPWSFEEVTADVPAGAAGG